MHLTMQDNSRATLKEVADFLHKKGCCGIAATSVIKYLIVTIVNR